MIRSEKTAWKITAVLFAAQCLGSAAFIAISTVGAILAASLSGHKSWAGAPAAASLFAGAGAAFLWGYLMDSMGRRGALVLGLVLGSIGAAVSFSAILLASFPLFLGGMLLVGVANAAVNLSRFTAAEVHTPATRGRAISMVVLGGTVGAIIGPFLIVPAGHLATATAINELAGAFAAAVILLLAAGAVVFAALRPDPRDIGRTVANPLLDRGADTGVPRSVALILRQPAAVAAVVAMVTSQVARVAVMVITSLFMKDMHHDLGDISLVFSAHTIGMYAFSLISGSLLDRWGRAPVIITGAAALVAASVMASISTATLPLAMSLLLLGLGWNFCFVGGSALLADQLSPAERARTQGFNDLLVGLAAGLASIGAGLASAALGYTGVGIIGAALSLLPIVLVGRWALSRPIRGSR